MRHLITAALAIAMLSGIAPAQFKPLPAPQRTIRKLPPPPPAPPPAPMSDQLLATRAALLLKLPPIRLVTEEATLSVKHPRVNLAALDLFSVDMTADASGTMLAVLDQGAGWGTTIAISYAASTQPTAIDCAMTRLDGGTAPVPVNALIGAGEIPSVDYNPFDRLFQPGGGSSATTSADATLSGGHMVIAVPAQPRITRMTLYIRQSPPAGARPVPLVFQYCRITTLG